MLYLDKNKFLVQISIPVQSQGGPASYFIRLILLSTKYVPNYANVKIEKDAHTHT